MHNTITELEHHEHEHQGMQSISIEAVVRSTEIAKAEAAEDDQEPRNTHRASNGLL
jgi:hypothetical protein